MLKRFIRTVRRKPKHVRDNYALGIASGVTALIIAVWMYHWPSMIESRQSGRDDVEAKPFATFMEQAKEQIATAHESTAGELSTLEDAVKEEAAPLPSQIDFGQAFQAGSQNFNATTSSTTGVQIATTSPTTTPGVVVQ